MMKSSRAGDTPTSIFTLATGHIALLWVGLKHDVDAAKLVHVISVSYVTSDPMQWIVPLPCNVRESWSMLSATYCMNGSDTLSTSTVCLEQLLHCTCKTALVAVFVLWRQIVLRLRKYLFDILTVIKNK